VFDRDRFLQWMDLVRGAGLHRQVAIIAGVFFLDSARRAEFLRSVPGVVLPDSTYDRLAGAEDQQAEGIKLACELVDWLVTVPDVRGVHLMGIEATASMAAIVQRSSLAERVATRGATEEE
jgi:5,10-methylenetetrahydrofolate reductase